MFVEQEGFMRAEEAGAGRRDEERDAPTDRQPDESGTPSGQRDAG
jgi:hypothetical protein